MKFIGVSRLALLGACITTVIVANAVLPLVAHRQLSSHLGSVDAYQAFVQSVTLVAPPFFFISRILLRGISSRTVCIVGLVGIAIFNFLLFGSQLGWHPVLLRFGLGVLFGMTAPIGQSLLAEAEMRQVERVRQYTLMLNIVALGLAIIPFFGVSILWASGGDPNLLFLALAIASLCIGISCFFWISPQSRVQPIDLRCFSLPKISLITACGDMLVIVFSRTVYAFVLVWLSQLILNLERLQLLSGYFVFSRVVFGFVAIPTLRRLSPNLSWNVVFLLPVLALSVSLLAGDQKILPILLVLVALGAIPEAFTPGQLVSQWSTASGRQFGTIVSMALMMLSLSCGPWLWDAVFNMSQSNLFHLWQLKPSPSISLMIFLLPFCCFPIWPLWKGFMIPPLKA
ncbi:MAG: hypothetical protein AB8E87_09920 [Prochlorococcus sp.]